MAKAAKIDVIMEVLILFLQCHVLQCLGFSLAFLEDKHVTEEKSCNFSQRLRSRLSGGFLFPMSQTNKNGINGVECK